MKMMKNQVCAVFVAYNPSDNIISNVVALITQVEEIVIVDNASCAKSKEYLDYLYNTYKVNVIRNNENLGIATALNIGVKYAINAGYFWIATFDQDSLAPPNFIDTMLNAYESCEYKDQVAIVAPTYLNQATGKVFAYRKNRNEGKLFGDVQATITSGNLVKSDIFLNVGFFDEGFFIDYVDYEFCLRCRKNKLKIIEVYDLILIHNLGSSSLHNLLLIQFTATNHSPLRRYYKYRNMMIVYRYYLLFDFVWVLSDIKYFIVEPIKILLFEKEKMSKIYYVFKGIYHGIKGIKGQYREHYSHQK